MLSASPLAKGLVRRRDLRKRRLLRSATRSGRAGREHAPARQRREGRSGLHARMRAPPRSPNCARFRRRRLLAATRGLAWPIIDGWVIPSDQVTLYDAKKFNDTPILIGYNSDEGSELLALHRHRRTTSTASSKRYGGFADKLLEAYPAGDKGHPKSARDLSRDAAFGWHTWTWARKQSSLGTAQGLSLLLRSAPRLSRRFAAGRTMAPGTAARLPYVFGHLNELAERNAHGGGPRASDAMVTYWTNFAKYGNPNGAGMPALAGLQRSKSASDGSHRHAASGAGSEPSGPEAAGCLFRLAPFAGGRESVGGRGCQTRNDECAGRRVSARSRGQQRGVPASKRRRPRRSMSTSWATNTR